MKRAVFKLSTLLLSVVTVVASAYDVTCGLQFETGYRNDDLKYKTTLGTTPETTFRQDFKDLDIWTIGVTAKGRWDCWLYGRARAEYGWISSSRATSRVESESNSTNFGFDTPTDTNRVHYHAKGDYVSDYTIAIGYPIEFCCSRLFIAPLVGYAYDVQKINSRASQEFLDNNFNGPTIFAPSFIETEEIHRTTESKWSGAWVGCDVSYYTENCFKLYGEFEYHFANVDTRVSTRTETSSFSVTNTGRATGEPVVVSTLRTTDTVKKHRRANGVNLRVGASRPIWCDWIAGVHVDYRSWRSNKGSNHVTWDSVGVGIDLGLIF